MTGHVVERLALAKINLDLRILGIRGDGYHELATVFQSISLCDRLRFELTSDDAPFVIRCTDSAVPVDRRNLVWKAAAALWEASGRAGEPRGVTVTLAKGIPSQAGLGGGSADAAVALSALSCLWPDPARPVALGEVAARIGADVPYFLIGGTALGRDRGDRLEAWPDGPDYEILLVHPPFGVSTADAYRWYDERDRPLSQLPGQPTHVSQWPRWLAGCLNDLEAPVAAHHSLFGDIRRALRPTHPRLAMMSGSGSTFFALYDEGSGVDAGAAAVAELGVTPNRARTVSRTEYARLVLGA